QGEIAERVAVWAVINTKTLDSSKPAVRLRSAVLQSLPFGLAPSARQQKEGPTPLRSAISANFLGLDPPPPANQPLELLDALDPRMSPVVLSNGLLWGALTTGVRVHGETRAGVAVFAVKPLFGGADDLGGVLSAEGYLALDGHDLFTSSVAASG